MIAHVRAGDRSAAVLDARVAARAATSKIQLGPQAQHEVARRVVVRFVQDALSAFIVAQVLNGLSELDGDPVVVLVGLVVPLALLRVPLHGLRTGSWTPVSCAAFCLGLSSNSSWEVNSAATSDAHTKCRYAQCSAYALMPVLRS